MQRQLSKHHQHKDGSDRTQEQQQEEQDQEEGKEKEEEEQEQELCLHNVRRILCRCLALEKLLQRQSSIWANRGEEAPAKEPVPAAIISVARTKSSQPAEAGAEAVTRWSDGLWPAAEIQG
nr:uncharacterized protein LOC123003325 [Drosophila takahashii]